MKTMSKKPKIFCCRSKHDESLGITTLKDTVHVRTWCKDDARYVALDLEMLGEVIEALKASKKYIENRLKWIPEPGELFWHAGDLCQRLLVDRQTCPDTGFSLVVIKTKEGGFFTAGGISWIGFDDCGSITHANLDDLKEEK